LKMVDKKNKFKKKLRNAGISSLASLLLTGSSGCSTPGSIQKRRNYFKEYNNTKQEYSLEQKKDSETGPFMRINYNNTQGYNVNVGISCNFQNLKEIPSKMANSTEAYFYGLTALLDGDTWTRPFQKENWEHGQRAETYGESTRYLAIIGSALYCLFGDSGGSGGNGDTPREREINGEPTPEHSDNLNNNQDCVDPSNTGYDPNTGQSGEDIDPTDTPQINPDDTPHNF
jgi:hypothetical protein